MLTEFDVIENQDVDEFKKQINNRLADGWELHGELIAFPYMIRKNGDVESILYIQGITKRQVEIPGIMKKHLAGQ